MEILAKEGEEVTVLMDYTSPEKTSSGLAAIQTKLHIEKGGKSTSGSGAAVRE